MSFTTKVDESKIRKEQKEKRIQEVKNLETLYSKEICELYREYKNQQMKKEEYQKVIEVYRGLIQEIEELKQTKEEIIRAKEQAEIDREKERALYEEYLQKMETKKKQFDAFMKRKGTEAFSYFKRLRETENQLIEEIYRFDKKKKTKNEYTEKSKEIVNKFKEAELKRKIQEEQNANEFNPSNVLYKLTTPFHNNGNKIDYSTTRFHNVVVVKHKDELSEYVNAFDKAKEESEKVKQIKKDKQIKIDKFNKNTEQNFREIIRKNKAKENLAQLTSQLEKITKAKKKNHLSNKANTNSNINNAKDNEKKSEYLVNKLLAQQNSNRTKILNSNPSKENKGITDNSVANEDSMRNFYKDDSSLIENNDDYFTRAIQEHNEEIDKALQTQKYYFEEPIARDQKPIKEKISRISPVDLPSYQKAEYEKEVNIVHKEPQVTMATQIRNSLRMTSNNSELGSSSIMENSTFSILDALNMSSKPIKEEEKGKGKIGFKEFYNKVSSARPGNKKGVVAGTGLWNIKEEVEGPGWEEEEKRKDSERSKKDNKK